MQTTLFGKLAKKKPFFEKSLFADSGYYAVIEALWTVEPFGGNRQTFFEKSASKRVCHRCTFDGCGAVFSSYYQLTQHKQKEDHTMARGRPRKK